MKTRIFTLLIISLFAFCVVSAQTEAKKNNATGKWNFEAPYAPEGYNLGTIDIAVAQDRQGCLFSGRDPSDTYQRT